MPDLTTKEKEDAFAAETAVVTKFYYYMPEDKKRQARDTLRHLTQFENYKEDNGSADVIIEQIWNQLVRPTP